MEYLASTGARRALGLTQRQLEYFLVQHPELEPARVAGRRIFGPEDLERIRAAVCANRERQAVRQGGRTRER